MRSTCGLLVYCQPVWWCLVLVMQRVPARLEVELGGVEGEMLG